MAATLWIIDGYKSKQLFDSRYVPSLEWIGYAFFNAAEFVAVVLVIDAYRRFNKCLKHDEL